jgi:hypothetical protein
MNWKALTLRISICMLAGLVFGLVISEVSYYFLQTGETRPPETVEIDIPQGTARAVAEGRADSSLPASLNFVLGDTLTVRNNDEVVHQLGPLVIPPGAAASMKLDAVQDDEAACSFQPSKYIGLKVQSPLTLGTRVVGILESGIPMGFLFALYGVFGLPITKVAK